MTKFHCSTATHLCTSLPKLSMKLSTAAKTAQLEVKFALRVMQQRHEAAGVSMEGLCERQPHIEHCSRDGRTGKKIKEQNEKTGAPWCGLVLEALCSVKRIMRSASVLRGTFSIEATLRCCSPRMSHMRSAAVADRTGASHERNNMISCCKGGTSEAKVKVRL